MLSTKIKSYFYLEKAIVVVCYKEKVILALTFAEYCKVNDNIKGKLQWQISQIIDVKIDEL